MKTVYLLHLLKSPLCNSANYTVASDAWPICMHDARYHENDNIDVYQMFSIGCPWIQ